MMVKLDCIIDKKNDVDDVLEQFNEAPTSSGSQTECRHHHRVHLCHLPLVWDANNASTLSIH